MLSKNKIKYIKSLSEKKARLESGLFVIEGEKMVKELFSSGFNISEILITEKNSGILSQIDVPEGCEAHVISEQDMDRISNFRTPPGILACAGLPDYLTSAGIKPDFSDWVIALDDIQDPGNMGTIIRTADWFGIRTILGSRNTVDVFNPKVIQSTMGAIFRVKLHYVDLYETLQSLKNQEGSPALLAAVLGGNNLYKVNLPSRGILMMGNESKGLSKELMDLSDLQLEIPNFGNPGFSGESLNVSMATGIILSEIRRNQFR